MILMFVYFFIILPMIVNFWLSFDDCFLLEFWLSLMIVFESYVDCFLWLFFMIALDWVLIVFDDCFFIEFWLSLMIVFESYFELIHNFWWWRGAYYDLCFPLHNNNHLNELYLIIHSTFDLLTTWHLTDNFVLCD